MMESCAPGLTSWDFVFPFILILYPPVCSTVPASLQAQGCRPRDCNKAKVELKGRVIFPLRQTRNFMLFSISPHFSGELY